jgi:hypothetical protein
MFSGWGTKLKSTFGLDDKNTPPEPAVVEKPRDKLTFVPNEPLTEAPAEPDFADPAPDDTEAVPIPGAVLIDHIEQRQQLLAVRRRQIVSVEPHSFCTSGLICTFDTFLRWPPKQIRRWTRVHSSAAST